MLETDDAHVWMQHHTISQKHLFKFKYCYLWLLNQEISHFIIRDMVSKDSHIIVC